MQPKKRLFSERCGIKHATINTQDFINREKHGAWPLPHNKRPDLELKEKKVSDDSSSTCQESVLLSFLDFQDVSVKLQPEKPRAGATWASDENVQYRSSSYALIG